MRGHWTADACKAVLSVAHSTAAHCPSTCSFLRNTISSGEAATMTQKLLCALLCFEWGLGDANAELDRCAGCAAGCS